MLNRKKELYRNILLYTIFALVVIFFLFPVLWALSLSFRSLKDVFKYPPHLIPSHFTFENYTTIFNTSLIKTYLMNSSIYVLFTAIGTIILSIPAAYAFSRMQNKARGPLLITILAFQMISPLIIAIPIYGYFQQFHLLNNYFGVIIAYIAIQLPFTTWLMKGYFDSIPVSIEEAAMIDGCTRFQSLTRVVLPLSLPGLATALIFIVIQSWGQFLIPFILLSNSRLFPITLGLYQYQVSESIHTNFIAAASIISIIPAILIFLILQKFIVKSLTRGAVKG